MSLLLSLSLTHVCVVPFGTRVCRTAVRNVSVCFASPLFAQHSHSLNRRLHHSVLTFVEPLRLFTTPRSTTLAPYPSPLVFPLLYLGRLSCSGLSDRRRPR